MDSKRKEKCSQRKGNLDVMEANFCQERKKVLLIVYKVAITQFYCLLCFKCIFLFLAEMGFNKNLTLLRENLRRKTVDFWEMQHRTSEQCEPAVQMMPK